MPIRTFAGNLSVPNTGDSATFTYTSTTNGSAPNAQLTLTATNTATGTVTTFSNPITVTGQVPNGSTTWDFATLGLEPGTYTFQVSGTQQSASGQGTSSFYTGPTSSPYAIVCFLSGTMIATLTGDVAVETLAVGDLVMTASRQLVPVLWLGRQTVSTVFGMADTDLPVRIAAGALGDGLPLRDLRVTAAHALLLDGVLVNAGALVNGVTITRISRHELGETFPVFHVETENHEVILAEGVATETFMDNVSRTRFDNYAEFEALYGAEGNAKAELDQPRAMSPRQVPASVRARIAAQLPNTDRAAA